MFFIIWLNYYSFIFVFYIEVRAMWLFLAILFFCYFLHGLWILKLNLVVFLIIASTLVNKTYHVAKNEIRTVYNVGYHQVYCKICLRPIKDEIISKKPKHSKVQCKSQYGSNNSFPQFCLQPISRFDFI